LPVVYIWTSCITNTHEEFLFTILFSSISHSFVTWYQSSRSIANAHKETDSQSFDDTNPKNKYLNFSDPFNPFRIENGDNPAAALVSELLTTDNYVSWSRAISRALRAKNKLAFVTGTLSKPTDISDPLFEAWERCNDLVVSWLQNSVSPSVKSSLALVEDSRVLWLELRDRFTHQNGPRIFQLKRDLASLSQNQDNISTYFGHLKTLWDELAIYDPLPDCLCGKLKILHDRYDRDCVIQFLMGLSDAYSNTRDQIMLLDPLPSLNHVFSMIQQQERQHLMIPSIKSPDLMAMMAKPIFNSSKNFSKSTSQKTNRPCCSYCKLPGHSLENCFKVGNADPPQCTHCNMTGHIAEKCYKLHGYPPGHKLHGKNKGIAATVTQSRALSDDDHEEDSTESMMLTRSQYQQLLSLLYSKETSSAMALLSVTQPSSSSPNPHVSNSRVSGMATCFSTSTHSSSPTHISPWIIDTGATDHMICCTSLFTSITATVSYQVKLPNGQDVPVTHIGVVRLSKHLVLNHVLCVPSFNFNLLSAKKLTQHHSCCLIFLSNACFFQDLASWTTIGMGEFRTGLYHLLRSRVSPSASVDALPHLHPSTSFPSASATHTTSLCDLWHYRLGHISLSRLALITDPIITHNQTFHNPTPCSICPLAKQRRVSFPTSTNSTLHKFDLVHCDIWGPNSVIAVDGSRFFLTIVDDHSRTTWVYMLRNKSDTRSCFMTFYSLIETQFHTKIKTIRSDNGAEFRMTYFFQAKGIIHQRSCVDTPQQNGRVERKHQHIMNISHALMFQSHLPPQYWTDCVLTATYLINRTPTPLLHNKTPYEYLF
jgi:hypothetical protein